MENSSKKVIALLSAVFMTWGVITSANAVLVPYFKDIFALNYQQSMLVQVAFYLAPFVACIPTSILMNSKGYKKTLLYSLMSTVIGSILFYIMFSMHSYAGVLVAIFIIAVGIAAMQVVANPYIIKLTPQISSVKILTFTSSINSLGTVIAPVGIGVILATMGLANIYLVMALLIALLAFQIHRTNIQDFTYAKNSSAFTPLKALRHHREFIIGAMAIFTYVGIEVAIGTLTISYLHDPEVGNISMAKATAMLSIYWACAMAGRFGYSIIADKVNPTVSLMVSATVACGLLLFAIHSQSFIGGVALIAIGLCNSFIHPVIFATSIKKLGSLTGLGAAILIMCNIGGGVVPLIQASVIDMTDIATSYYVPLIGYIVIACYTISVRYFRNSPQWLDTQANSISS
ncbi:MFS transporter [Vibrio sp. DW001]|uniref:MFS transporter n=1 Tax=Vibrio sp. DW001 TaxID=2912315 RepID=UPI0023AF4E20|nr:MFS transporter [Vibrio sp. DW001]WED25799.1 MFS transporter [Vibrio sp. DW001]